MTTSCVDVYLPVCLDLLEHIRVLNVKFLMDDKMALPEGIFTTKKVNDTKKTNEGIPT